MSSEQNKAVIRRFIEEVWGKGDTTLLSDLADVNVADHNPMPNQASGIDGQRQAVNLFHSAFKDIRMKVEDLIAEGDKVVDHWTVSASNYGDFLGIPATGRSVTFTGTDIYRLVDGKIVELWHVEDILGLLQQLGAVPNMPGAQPPGSTGRSSRSQPRASTPPA